MKAFADFDALQVGDSRQTRRLIGEVDLRRFVEMTGDDNPLHVDREFAGETPFKDVVVHGMLGASFISTVIGTQLPGPGALWVSQSMEFLLPVRLGDELTVTCTVLKKIARDRLLELDTRIVNQHGQVVLQGTGRVKLLQGPTTAAQARGELARTALVTGGAGGIGEAICRRLASDGFRVVVNYQGSRDRAERIVADMNSERQGTAVAVQADVSTVNGIDQLLDATVLGFGPVGVLVNNASPRIVGKPITALAWQDIQQHLDVQLKSAFLLTQRCAPAMAERGAGRIVNITSQAVEGPPTAHWTAYAVAKSALSMFSRQMALELGPSGITVNCVAPGMTGTALIGDIPEKQQLVVARQTPLRRLAHTEDVAGAVSFLAGDSARFVTGQTLNVNGGLVMT